MVASFLLRLNEGRRVKRDRKNLVALQYWHGSNPNLVCMFVTRLMEVSSVCIALVWAVAQRQCKITFCFFLGFGVRRFSAKE